jgi:hypothetical protein
MGCRRAKFPCGSHRLGGARKFEGFATAMVDLRYTRAMTRIGGILRAAAIASVFAVTACDGNSSNNTPKAASQPPSGWRTYGDARLGFSIAYPEGWSVDTGHVYPTPVHDNRLAGVAFIVPQSLSAHTNLSSDSYVAVESADGVSSCEASDFLDQPMTQRNEMKGATRWSIATLGDAGAGNFYDETVYALEGSRPCLAIRYFIHSTNVANYPEGTVKQFDHALLVDMFDRIRSTFALSPSGTPR